MNNFHIYEEVGRGKYSVVYKVMISSVIKMFINYLNNASKFNHILQLSREERRKQ